MRGGRLTTRQTHAGTIALMTARAAGPYIPMEGATASKSALSSLLHAGAAGVSVTVVNVEPREHISKSQRERRPLREVHRRVFL